MSSWKTILLRSVGFGIGVTLALCGLAACLIWYNDRPKPPKPWDKQAIVAEYDGARLYGEKDDISFFYMLQNNTDLDYRIESKSGVEVTAKLKQEKGFSTFGAGFVTTDYPVFVPARSRVWIGLSIPYPYHTKEKDNPTPEERGQYSLAVEKYVTNELTNLDGFVLFDTSSRYEIDFPGGWEKQVKK
jgi:hypothetical protein